MPSALFIVSENWNTCRDSTLSQHRTIFNAPIATSFQDFEIHDRREEHGNKHGCRFGFCCYLEGATPTRFGPRPRNRDLGPSFSRIDLKNSNHINELGQYSVIRHSCACQDLRVCYSTDASLHETLEENCRQVLVTRAAWHTFRKLSRER